MTLSNKKLSHLSDLQPLTPRCTDPVDVNVLMLGTRDSSGFYSVQSTLMYKVLKEDKDARFSCEVSFFVPGAIRTVESSSINITVHCESKLTPSSPFLAQLNNNFFSFIIFFKWKIGIICARSC